MCKVCEDEVAMAYDQEYNPMSRLEHTCGKQWPKYINVYEVVQAYGGPQEGGWWYNCGTPIESVCVSDESDFNAAMDRANAKYNTDEDEWDIEKRRGSTSCAGGHDVVIYVEEHFAESFPESKPQYE